VHALPQPDLMQILVPAFLWEGEFDDKRARLFGTPAEAELDLKSGDVALATRLFRAIEPYPDSKSERPLRRVIR
jgi:hypothetical protein